MLKRKYDTIYAGTILGIMLWSEHRAQCQHNGHVFFQHKENDNEKTVLGNFYFQVLLVWINIFKSLIATFNVLLNHCVILLGY